MRWSPKRPSIPKKYQPWLQENWCWIQLVCWAVVALVIAVAFRRGAWLSWVGFSGKTVWDWLDLLGVPLSLAILGYILQQQQQKRAAEEEKEGILQTYFDRLSTLLIDKNLLAIADEHHSPSKEELETQSHKVSLSPDKRELLATAVDIIRARTLSILRRFADDPARKSSVIQFLLEAEVIRKAEIDLRGVNLEHINLDTADFRFADLSGADLSGANLSGAKFRRADLSGAKFRRADLSGAKFANTNLSDANLSRANLSNTKLFKANLSGANLSGANLSGANLSNANLSGANLFRGNLFQGNLRNTNLRNANLSEAMLMSTQRNENTQWPAPEEVAKAKYVPNELKNQLGLD